jgi:hypothetical protein
LRSVKLAFSASRRSLRRQPGFAIRQAGFFGVKPLAAASIWTCDPSSWLFRRQGARCDVNLGLRSVKLGFSASRRSLRRQLGFAIRQADLFGVKLLAAKSKLVPKSTQADFLAELREVLLTSALHSLP